VLVTLNANFQIPWFGVGATMAAPKTTEFPHIVLQKKENAFLSPVV
jgi:hypothetical protein